MKVEYDTRGETQQCPMTGEQTSDVCLRCPFFQSSDGFDVECDYYVLDWQEAWDQLAAKAASEAV